ncbi:BMP family ABC transporter substrate-binding protein [Metabacillus sp. GX 13764]|uniref:BMP family ABC transporter substrate-binding protein n=1 Tax=Metabacillus kandeliae TaxID=2900151 RepID=UPI001E4E308F|nr:BMP family ABC transporter substrate-binding protein [Metabacillus kandeliae]MCD7036360.1 BMP family ABC transporter substrate-binding protein [Metabacillus kandeliae]
MRQARQLRIVIFVAGLALAALVSAILFFANNVLKDMQKKPAVQTKVAILTSDVIEDQSWGSLAYKGKLKIERQFPADAKVDSQLGTEEQQVSAAKKDIDQGYQILIGHGREFSGVFAKLAPDYPKIKFITIHGEAKYPNQTVYTYDQGDVEYFAALAAVMKTKTGKIGLIDASESRAKNPEFEAAIKHYRPGTRFYYRVVNSRDDGKRAVELLEELKAKGVDVVYSKGNGYNRDVIEYAKHHSMYVIGYLDDQAYMGKEAILTSVTNDVPQIYTAIMKDYYGEKGISSGRVMLKEEDGVYGLSPFGPMFTEKEKRYIEKEMARYKKGELSF